MASMARDSWTDERLDDLNAKVERLDQRMRGECADIRNEIRGIRSDMYAELRALRAEFRKS